MNLVQDPFLDKVSTRTFNNVVNTENNRINFSNVRNSSVAVNIDYVHDYANTEQGNNTDVLVN